MPRILLVDDDPAILRLLDVNFRMEGFDVEATSHGEEALATAARQAPDVVVLDLMLPGMDGREILRRLREDPTTADVPALFLTARGRDDAMMNDDARYIQKPFDTVELVATVRAMLEGDE
ncbi:MAG: response regulator transcription factor [Actinomycetota bacterium]|jgi:DNA-binding response OmpR family regulator